MAAKTREAPSRPVRRMTGCFKEVAKRVGFIHLLVQYPVDPRLLKWFQSCSLLAVSNEKTRQG